MCRLVVSWVCVGVCGDECVCLRSERVYMGLFLCLHGSVSTPTAFQCTGGATLRMACVLVSSIGPGDGSGGKRGRIVIYSTTNFVFVVS